MGILFGTAQVSHRALVMVRVRHPGSGFEGDPETSWQRLRLCRDGPRESTLISVRYRDLQTPCILFSQLCDERAANLQSWHWHFAQSAASDGHRRLGR
jgi:hypothetical protein